MRDLGCAFLLLIAVPAMGQPAAATAPDRAGVEAKQEMWNQGLPPAPK